MRALITGANGLLGNFLCDYAQSHGHWFLATGRGQAQLTSPDRYVACDLKDEAAVNDLLEHVDIEIIIHCAAQLAGDTGESFQYNNVTATENLARAAKRHGIKKFLFCSTISVYAGNGPFLETSRTESIDFYSASKIAAEATLESLADQNFKVLVLRMAGLHGWPRTNGVVHTMLAAAGLGNPISIHEPATRISLTFIRDTAEIMVALWQMPWQQINTTYNLASPDTPTLLQLAQMIVSMSNSTSELQCGIGTARNRTLDISKLRRETGLFAATLPESICYELSLGSKKTLLAT